MDVHGELKWASTVCMRQKQESHVFLGGFLLSSDAALEKIFSYLLCIFSLDCRLLNTSFIVQAAPGCLCRAGLDPYMLNG